MVKGWMNRVSGATDGTQFSKQRTLQPDRQETPTEHLQRLGRISTGK